MLHLCGHFSNLSVLQKPSLSSIRNIIFDLGGVIINIDYQRSTDELRKLSACGKSIEFSQKSQSPLFDQYETGAISSEEFRKQLREAYELNGEDTALDAGWNAMLLDIPKERIGLLQRLGKTHRLFLLSNTNEIHLQAFNQIVRDSFGLPDLGSLFEKAYYSHEIGMRKPDAAPFEHILKENNLERSETLFIDDSIQHVTTARSIGIPAIHLQPPATILNIFDDAE
jgi:FMN phosphatase YigB (HAD superfamily)